MSQSLLPGDHIEGVSRQRLLVIGGTAFVGRHFVEACIAAGHEVTVFHRGKTAPKLFPEARRVIGHRELDLAGLADGSWDATIDFCAYLPRQVSALADVLGSRGGRYVLISSVMVYPNETKNRAVETAALCPPLRLEPLAVDMSNYGSLKAMCEQVALSRFGADTLILRPSTIIGPYDYTGRLTYWLRRLAAGGAILAPAPPESMLQLVDVRDMATWLLRLVTEKASGVFNVASVGAQASFAGLLNIVAEAVDARDYSLIWPNEKFLAAAGVTPDDLPLWPGLGRGRLEIATEKARAAGLVLRSLPSTVIDLLQSNDMAIASDDALSPAREQQLINAWTEHSLTNPSSI